MASCTPFSHHVAVSASLDNTHVDTATVLKIVRKNDKSDPSCHRDQTTEWYQSVCGRYLTTQKRLMLAL